MTMRAFVSVFVCLIIASGAFAQVCTNPGQTPSTAFPLCGRGVFSQTTVPICDGTPMPSIHCPNDGLRDRNPFWYKFSCLKAGTLGFVITPRTLDEDYDWELYDVTGTNPNNVYVNGNLVVACNWSGEFGVTGASNAGNELFVCAGSGQDLFTRMPQLQLGHQYLLLISHFTNTQSGYTLEFKGGTAVITDTTAPRLRDATVNCAADVLTISLKKKVKCTSIAADGSDFFITPVTGATIQSINSVQCGVNQFDTDSIQIRLSQPLPAGTYTLNVRNGSDGNTLLDYCDNPMPGTDVATFTVLPSVPTPMDSLALGCSVNTMQLVFSKPILCSSIAADGSDFIVNGSYPLSISTVNGNCVNGKTNIITLTMSEVLRRPGNFVIQLQRGTDGNTLIDECGIETPAGQSIPFRVRDTVNADFTYTIQYGCSVDQVNFLHPGGNEVNKWTWKLDQGFTSNIQSPQANYTIFTPKSIELIVTNGMCSDTSRTIINLENYLKAEFTILPDLCPKEPVIFAANSIGKITRHDWSFGDGSFGTGSPATHIFAQPNRETALTVRYTVTDSFGCSQTIQKPIKVYSSCIVAVPNAFTPNGNGKNEFLYPLNAVKAEQLEFMVYNRWGQMIYRTSDWKRGWDGTLNGVQQPTGTYVWVLRYIDRDTRKRIERKGFTILIR